ncbi:MAG TPA: protoporphyrinogen oxidase [Candidatus Acidoferrum sp.]
MSTQIQTLVIGAGISGLATAYSLQKAGISTLIVDSAPRPGGVIQSMKRDGYLLECGPQSFSGNSQLTTLCDDLGLLGDRVLADPKAPRYVLIDGQLKAVPMSPALLTSSFLGGGTRSSIVRDVLGRSKPPEPDESVASFIRRKFSSTLLDQLVGPFVSGIYAGDPEKLSLRAAFPILYEAEKASGSIVRGMFKVLKQRKAENASGPHEKPTLQTFQGGNETLIRALAEDLDERLLCGVEASSIEALDPGHEPKAPRFRITLRSSKGVEILETERLVIAAPTNVAAKLLNSCDPAFESNLSPVEYSGVAVVSLGYRKQDIGNPLNGFGFLVPRSSGLSVLGAVWNSSLFPGRAPEGHILLTSFMGGATNPGAALETSEYLSGLAHRELTSVLGIRKEPAFTNVTIWPRAIPQYNVGHVARLAALDKIRANFPGLYFSGNYLNGPAIGTCVEHALKIANEIRVSFAN